MVDTHAHILAGVDDGPPAIEDAIALIERAAGEGISDIIATPHALHPYFHVETSVIRQRIVELRTAIEEQGIPVSVHTGHEVRLYEELREGVKRAELLTLAGSRYVLIELPSYSVPPYTFPVISQLVSEGYVPIIAHAEKNRGIAEDPSRLTELIAAGACAQVTAGSLSGHFGHDLQRTAYTLIQMNLIHVYGSDVHNIKSRPFEFMKGLDFLERKNELDTIDLLLENNARILQDEEFIIPEPKPQPKKPWWRLH